MITEQSTATPERAMSEDKRRSYAVDDVQTIARRMKEIAAEREAAVAENAEPSGWPAFETSALADLMAVNNQLLDAYRDRILPKVNSIYADEFWQPLIDAGILTVGDA
jgi:hypothetical protein